MAAGVNLGIAFIAGLLSFVSPCVLPLIPSYVSIIAGTSFQDLLQTRQSRRKAFVNTIFFIIGFSILFIASGVFLSTTFDLLGRITRIINIVAGAIIIFLGINFIFDFWKILSFERRFQLKKQPSGKLGTLLFGMAFGAGWSPCIGPILVSILALASTSGEIGKAVLLLSVYSLGLGVPFLLAGAFFSGFMKQMAKIRRHLPAIKIVSGVFLIFIGILILVGRLQRFNAFLFSFAYRLESWGESAPGQPPLVFGIIFCIAALAVLFFYLRRVRQDKKAADENVAVNPVRPVRMFFIAVFLVLSVFSFTGVVDLTNWFSVWLSFQGI